MKKREKRRGRVGVALLLFCMIAVPSGAFLPPDADAWATRRIEERRRGEQDYEQRREELHREAARAREQVRRDIVSPPWMRSDPVTQATVGAEDRFRTETEAARQETEKKNSRLLVSILLLSFIGVACGGVAWATREQ